MKVVAHFMKQSKTDDFKGFIAENSPLKTKFRALIESHYSFDIFNNEKARATFLQPDLQPF